MWVLACNYSMHEISHLVKRRCRHRNRSSLPVGRLLKCYVWRLLRSGVQLSEDGAWRSELPGRRIWFWQHHALCQEHLLKVGVSGYTFWLLIPFLCMTSHKALSNIRAGSIFKYSCHKIQKYLNWYVKPTPGILDFFKHIFTFAISKQMLLLLPLWFGWIFLLFLA